MRENVRYSGVFLALGAIFAVLVVLGATTGTAQAAGRHDFDRKLRELGKDPSERKRILSTFAHLSMGKKRASDPRLAPGPSVLGVQAMRGRSGGGSVLQQAYEHLDDLRIDDPAWRQRDIDFRMYDDLKSGKVAGGNRTPAATKQAKIDLGKLSKAAGRGLWTVGKRAMPWVAWGTWAWWLCDSVTGWCNTSAVDNGDAPVTAGPCPADGWGHGCLNVANATQLGPNPPISCDQFTHSWTPGWPMVHNGLGCYVGLTLTNGIECISDAGGDWPCGPPSVSGMIYAKRDRVPVGSAAVVIGTLTNGEICALNNGYGSTCPKKNGVGGEWYGHWSQFQQVTAIPTVAEIDPELQATGDSYTINVTNPPGLSAAGEDAIADALLDGGTLEAFTDHVLTEGASPDPYSEGIAIPRPRADEDYVAYLKRLEDLGLVGYIRLATEANPAPYGTRRGQVYRVQPGVGETVELGSRVAVYARSLEPHPDDDPATGAGPDTAPDPGTSGGPGGSGPGTVTIAPPTPTTENPEASCQVTWPKPDLDPFKALGAGDKFPFGLVTFVRHSVGQFSASAAPTFQLPAALGRQTVNLGAYAGPISTIRNVLGWMGALGIVVLGAQWALGKRWQGGGE